MGRSVPDVPPRSPFATALTETYRYDGDQVKAWREKVVPIIEGQPPAPPEREEVPFHVLWDLAAEDYEGMWVRLRLPNSRRDISSVVSIEQPTEIAYPDGRIERAYRNMDSKRDVFLLLCEAWSISSQPTSEEYGRLEPWVYSWIDACVLDAVARGMTSYQKKDDSSAPPKSGRARSKPAAESSPSD